MSEKDWWNGYGTFKRWNECPSRPDPSEVLLFYLQKRGIQPEEHVSFLMDLLDLQKSMVYNILSGQGFDAISRCRQLIEALKIHPPLLGIDAKFWPIERHPSRWSPYRFELHADAQGYPLMSEVVAYLRTKRTQVIEGGKVKVWSQEDLGDATGLKKETVYRAEHDRNPLILESMSRRAIMASALGTLSKDIEPTLFRVFGLDPQAYGVPVPAHEYVPEVHFLPEHLTDETLLDYKKLQATFFKEYLTCHAQDTLGDVLEWLRRLPMLLPMAKTTAQRVNILALQCRYHELIVGIAREQRKSKVALFHADKAITLAEQATQLPNLKLDNPAQLLISNELVAAALLWRAEAYYELSNYDMAQTNIDRALSFLPTLQSNQLKLHIVADAGLIRAHTARSEVERTLALSYFSLAAQINVPSRHQPHSNAPDDNFIYCGTGTLYLRKAMALSAPNMKGATEDSVRDLLEDAQRLTPPELIRQHTLIEVLQALDHFAASDYQQATEIAL